MSEKSNADLDLIQMVQRARMQHDNAAKPSQIAGVYWVEAKCQIADRQQSTPRSGQWVLTTTVDAVDTLWEQVKAATESGQLGYKAKVSTASRNRADADQRLLVVCTYDKDDQSDVDRVREVLTKLGLSGEWRYEAD